MPHKHKRDKSKNDPSFYDLPPTKTAHPLPVRNFKTATAKSANKLAKRKHAQTQDDTPRAFARLLGNYRPPRFGLDDGIRPSKKVRKETKPEPRSSAPSLAPTPVAVPTIQPYEPLSAFSARVDAALPFSGLSKKNGGAEKVGRERQTKTERKMQKMQKEWREEDRRRKAKLDEEELDGVDVDGLDELSKTNKNGKSKGGKRQTRRNDRSKDIINHDDDDPWAHLATKRREENDARTASGSGAGGLVGLHDVVSAPPKFSRVPRENENLKIIRAGGGLKRQQEMSEARMTIIEGYRQMMRGKREQ